MSASGTKYCKRDASSDTDPTAKVLFNPGTVRVEMNQAKVEKECNRA
jgi:hypothetical protein